MRLEAWRGARGWTRVEVVDKDGAVVEEGAWEGRLREDIGRERVDIPVVQKPSSEVAATADEEGTLIWAEGV